MTEKAAGLYLLGGAAAVALGWVASTGSLPGAAIVVGLVAGLILISNPTLLLFSVLLGGLVVSGLTMLYVPQLQLIRWGVAAASMMLIVLSLMDTISRRFVGKGGEVAPITWYIVGWLAVAALAGLANGQGTTQFVVSMKAYMQVAGLFFALVMMPWPRKVIDALPKLILAVAFIQLPFVLHQVLVLVPRRMGYGEGVVPYDVVAGTFGATMFGGGANAVLSAFMLIVFAVLLALWNSKAISLRQLLFMSLPLLAPIFVNESKVSAFYLLLIVLIIFKNEIVVRPGRALLSGGFLALFLVALVAAYSTFYDDREMNGEGLIERTVKYNFSDEQGHGEYYLNRFTVLPFWVQEHSLRRPMTLLIGHGPRASREGEGGMTSGDDFASRNYPGMGIGLIGASAVLWETGLIGLGLVAAMFLAAFRMAGELRVRFMNDPYRSGLFSGLQAGVAIMALSMFHKAFFVFDIGYQTIVMLLFGYLAYYYVRTQPTHSSRKVTL